MAQASTCAPTCLDGYYITQSNTCAQCDPSCFRCSSSANCTQCNSGWYLSGDSCVQQCPPGSYGEDAIQYLTANITNNPEMAIVYFPYCATCDPSCAACTGPNNTQCTSCAPNYANNTILLNGALATQCIDRCPDGKYVSQGSCSDCPVQCATCTNPTTCVTCTVGEFLYGSQCGATCPTGTFANTATGQCETCYATCATCTASGSSGCSSCLEAYFQYGSQCLGTCPDGTYTRGTQCSPCLQNCATCINGNSCSSC